MKRLLDDSIGHMRTVVVAGIDVVHAGLYGLAQNLYSLVNVAWRTEYSRACELHGSIAHSVHRRRCTGYGKAAGKISLFNHSVPPEFSMHLTPLDEGSFRFGVRIMPTDTISALEPRKTPVQARSTVTVEAISEATIQVLLTHGAERL